VRIGMTIVDISAGGGGTAGRVAARMRKGMSIA
jgi:hypothetical protein